MLFLTLITLVICKAWLNDRLPQNFFPRITSIALLFSAMLNYNVLLSFNTETVIGVYNGLFHVTYITQIVEIFILIIGAIIIGSPIRDESYTILPLSLKPNFNSLPYVGEGSEGEVGDLLKIKILSNNNFTSYTINYSILVLFCTLGASLLISCSDLISMYLSIELQSFSLYVLSTLYKNSELATSAGLKYFLLGGLSSCLILFGAGLIYAYTGLTNFESIYSFMSIYSIEINNNLVQNIYPFLSEEYSSSIFLGFIFIFVGFLFKISAAPFHNWSPDVYDDTPTIVTIWLTLIPKISILILLLELHIHIDLIDQLTLPALRSGAEELSQLKLFSLNIDTITKNLLLISSLLSLIIGSVVGLAQNRIKRLLAYSTISHIGYILLALGIYTEQSISSFIFYIIQYIITNLNIFLIIIALGYVINFSINNDNKNTPISVRPQPSLSTPYGRDGGRTNLFKDIRYISELKGQFFEQPVISLCLIICLFSIAGIPPLMGFFSKQFVLYSAIQSGYNFIALVAIFLSVISASYYLKIIKTMLIKEKKPSVQILYPRKWLKDTSKDGYINLSKFHSFTISTLTLSILFFLFKSSLIINITQLLSLSLFYI